MSFPTRAIKAGCLLDGAQFGGENEGESPSTTFRLASASRLRHSRYAGSGAGWSLSQSLAGSGGAGARSTPMHHPAAAPEATHPGATSSTTAAAEAVAGPDSQQQQQQQQQAQVDAEPGGSGSGSGQAAAAATAGTTTRHQGGSSNSNISGGGGGRSRDGTSATAHPPPAPPAVLPAAVVPAVLLGDVFMACNTLSGILATGADADFDWREHAAASAAAGALRRGGGRARSKHAAATGAGGDGQAAAAAAAAAALSGGSSSGSSVALGLDPATKLMVRMAVPLHGRRLFFVSRDSAEMIRQALVLERYAAIREARAQAGGDGSGGGGSGNSIGGLMGGPLAPMVGLAERMRDWASDALWSDDESTAHTVSSSSSSTRGASSSGIQWPGGGGASSPWLGGPLPLGRAFPLPSFPPGVVGTGGVDGATPPHQLVTLVSELKRLDEEAVLAEGAALLGRDKGSSQQAQPWWAQLLPWGQGTKGGRRSGSGVSSSSLGGTTPDASCLSSSSSYPLPVGVPSPTSSYIARLPLEPALHLLMNRPHAFSLAATAADARASALAATAADARAYGLAATAADARAGVAATDKDGSAAGTAGAGAGAGATAGPAAASAASASAGPGATVVTLDVASAQPGAWELTVVERAAADTPSEATGGGGGSASGNASSSKAAASSAAAPGAAVAPPGGSGSSGAGARAGGASGGVHGPQPKSHASRAPWLGGVSGGGGGGGDDPSSSSSDELEDADVALIDRTPVFRIPGVTVTLGVAGAAPPVHLQLAFLSVGQVVKVLAGARRAAGALWIAQRRDARTRWRSSFEAGALAVSGLVAPPIGGGGRSGSAPAAGNGGSGGDAEEDDEDGHGDPPEAKQLLQELGEGGGGRPAIALPPLDPPRGVVALLNTGAVGIVSLAAAAYCSAADVIDRAAMGNDLLAPMLLGLPDTLALQPTYLEDWVEDMRAENAAGAQAAAAAAAAGAAAAAPAGMAAAAAPAAPTAQPAAPLNAAPPPVPPAMAVPPASNEGGAQTAAAAGTPAAAAAETSAVHASAAGQAHGSFRPAPSPEPDAAAPEPAAAAQQQQPQQQQQSQAQASHRTQTGGGKKTTSRQQAPPSPPLPPEALATLSVLMLGGWSALTELREGEGRMASDMVGLLFAGSGQSGLSASSDELGISLSVDLAAVRPVPGVGGVGRGVGGGQGRAGKGGKAAHGGGQQQGGGTGAAAVLGRSTVEVGLFINLAKLTGAQPPDAPDALLAQASRVKPGAASSQARHHQTGVLLVGDVCPGEDEAVPGSTDALLAALRPPALGAVDLGGWRK
ncbi:hypothetical protein FOA52_004522 [Chlamydomonas sp. UWO 241]|nr:hypothetical protein FOA52_004522 [Chlamydomonas sp. UWO 241]